MIRISLISKHYQQIEPLIQQFFDDLQIEYKLTNYTHQTVQDIYFVEIEKKNDLNILNHLKKLNSTLIYIIGPKDFDLVQYCPYCGNVEIQPWGPLCSYCKHKMVEVPEEQFTAKSLVDEELNRRQKVYEETGNNLGIVVEWEVIAYERLKIEENPQFNPSLRNLRLYKQKKLSDPCVECPVCGSMNTYFLDPDRKTEYTGLFGGTNSNYGKTFGCVTCGHKW